MDGRKKGVKKLERHKQTTAAKSPAVTSTSYHYEKQMGEDISPGKKQKKKRRGQKESAKWAVRLILNRNKVDRVIISVENYPGGEKGGEPKRGRVREKLFHEKTAETTEGNWRKR